MSSSGPSKLDDSAAVELTGKIMVVAIIVLFAVVVFVLCLHLYAKWFWWSIEEANTTSPPSRRRRRRRFVFAPGQDPAVANLRRGLEPLVLRSLPVLEFNPKDFKDGLECAVCLSELEEGEKARLLPKCNHGFHVDCIDMWFQSHSTCPICRNPVAPPQGSNSNSTNAEMVAENALVLDEPQGENSASGYSIDSPNFPTNVLFWGNQTQVSSGTASLEEGPSSSSSASSGVATRPVDGALVIDIPRLTTENLSSSLSPSASRFVEEESKSPMTTRLRSLKRLLSRERQKKKGKGWGLQMAMAMARSALVKKYLRVNVGVGVGVGVDSSPFNFNAIRRRFFSEEVRSSFKSEVTDRVISVVKNFQKVDPSKVTPNANFQNDLGLDSLDSVEIVMALEEEFGFEIPDKEADKINSINLAVDFIASHPQAK